MPTRYVLRVQVDATDEADAVAERLLALVKETRAEEISVFFSHMEFFDGHETLESISAWLESSRPWRTALRQAGFAVSLNPPHEIGHADWGRRRKPGQHWQPLVDQRGRAAEVQVCPLDPGWRAYYAEAMRRYAAEDFDVIWVEDDIRLHNHAPLDWGGCFCDLHLADFARRTGVHVARDELVAACTAPGEPHPWRQLWLDCWQKGLLELVESWRPIVTAYGSRLGLMSSRLEEHAAEGRWWDRWLAVFDVHRPHFWPYGDVPGDQLPMSIVELDAQSRMRPANLVSYPEIENWPYWRWNKSYRQTAAQIALAHILGSDGLSLSLYDFPGNRPEDDPTRADFLAQWRPAHDWLADTFPKSLRTTGIGVPWSPDSSRRIRLSISDDRSWFALRVPLWQWASWLGACGHAFTAGPGDVVALAGRSVWGFTDEQLSGWLAGSVLLDGIAAKVLCERGFGDAIGLRDVAFRGDAPVASLEVCTDPEFSLWPGAKISLDYDAYRDGTLIQGVPVEGAVVASRLHDPRHRDLGHGLILYRNASGGRVATVPWHLTGTKVLMTPHREHQLAAVLDWLGARHARAWGHPWLITQTLTDGTRWRVVVWNASPDDVSTIRLRLPAGMPDPAECTQLTADGDRLPAGYAAGELTLTQPLRQWEFAVLRVP